ncbi:hypothetical protein BD310DRAFT_926682 [Dichomitus squalens]|uniref:Uncharacterized protein n=1 Tax=Dichomitus squalens TaxID=114155 RepID=A0A4Q9PVP9_9APHY|nr:hypothetical protein BD310DRAFT_926682 [Dichomitus squalens]
MGVAINVRSSLLSALSTCPASPSPQTGPSSASVFRLERPSCTLASPSSPVPSSCVTANEAIRSARAYICV